MSRAISSLRVVRALCVAALLSSAWAATAFAQNAPAAVTMQRKQVVITSIAAEGRFNAVDFSGQVTIASRLARDPEFGNHKLVLIFDMSGLSGTQGRTTYRTAYQEEFVKPHAANMNIEFVFPVSVETEATLSQVVTAVAKFALNVDPATGDITSAAATIAAR